MTLVKKINRLNLNQNQKKLNRRKNQIKTKIHQDKQLQNLDMIAY